MSDLQPGSTAPVQSATTVSTSRSTDVLAGWVLILSTVLTIFVIMHHPVGKSSSMRDFIDEVAHMQSVNRLVHGAAIFAVLIFLSCNSHFASRLGWKYFSVRLGFCFYGLGTLLMVAAATVSGFIVPEYLEGLRDATDRELESGSIVLLALRETNHACDQLGVLAFSVALICWSAQCLGQAKRLIVVGTVGLLAGAVGLVGLFTGHLGPTVHGVLLFLGLQAGWNLCVGWQLIRPYPPSS